MSTPTASSPALPIAREVLRILIAANWLIGAGFLALVISPDEQWIVAAFKLTPSPDTQRQILAMRVVIVLTLAEIALYDAILRRLLAIVLTVRAGDPFVAANAHRLQAIGWALLALQLLSLVVGAIGMAVSTPTHPVHLDTGFSVSGWLAVILTFLLARVFAEGARMREDLVGTV